MKKIAAIVVTHNRSALLMECIRHINAQTQPCDIVIVDNNSTDSTAQAVKTVQREGLWYFNTGENLGGAGGFSFGFQKAVELGYEYLWAMDDDTMPEPDTLEKFFEADHYFQGNYGFLASRVLWTDGSDCTMNTPRKTPYRDMKVYHGPYEKIVMSSFVSFFVKREIVLKYGYPIKEFFIWSDDWEYTRRISLKEKCYAVRDSHVMHAMESPKPVNIAGDSDDRIDRYQYFYRNDIFLYRREGIKGWLWLIAKYSWHSLQVILFSDHKAEKLSIIWKGFAAGIHFHPPYTGINSGN